MDNSHTIGRATRPAEQETTMAPINADLLKILACPKCKAPIREVGDELHCTAAACGLIYPVRDGIPIMLIEEARAPVTAPGR